LKNQLNNLSSELKALINEPRNIVIITHVNPDGDAMGASLAIYQYLLKKKHNVTVVTPNEYPDFLKWMKGSDQVVEYKSNREKATDILINADLMICADFNEIDRVVGIKEQLSKIKAKRLLIDHHQNPPDLYDYTYITTETTSTSELIYRFIREMDDLSFIDTDMAECIFAGIMTDTGCFSHNSSYPLTYEIIADLLRKGIDKDKIFNFVYNNYSETRMQLMGYALNEKMTIIPEYHTAYMTLSKIELERYNFIPGDTEGFVNLPFTIKGIHVCALFVERKDFIKISLRSHGDFAVNTICEQYFKGGGHKNASGGETRLSLNDAVKLFLKILKEHENELKSIS
jgi:bifunctional oligoribonuclease and PAP phosphatase NrnA